MDRGADLAVEDDADTVVDRVAFFPASRAKRDQGTSDGAGVQRRHVAVHWSGDDFLDWCGWQTRKIVDDGDVTALRRDHRSELLERCAGFEHLTCLCLGFWKIHGESSGENHLT